MESAKISNLEICRRSISGNMLVLALFFLLPATLTAAETVISAIFGDPVYRRSVENSKIILEFGQSWSFDRIELPAVSTELWGDSDQYRAAVIKIERQTFISNLNNDKTRLIYQLRGATASRIEISPILKNRGKFSPGSQPGFTATPARIRHLEDELTEHANSVLSFQKRNNCFSCHTAIPLVLTCKVAAASGMRVPHRTLRRIGNDIATMQNENGIYHFPQHPDYGTISPTLAAGAIMAIISDFSRQYLDNLQKIRMLLPDWYDKNHLVKSDFYFRPLFIGPATNMLFEALILQTLYLYRKTGINMSFDESLRQRLQVLRKQAAFSHTEPIHRQILLIVGTPVLFQFSTEKRPLIIEQLLRLLAEEPEGKRPDIRALALLLLKKFAPKQSLPERRFGRVPQNSGDRIWSCLEEIIISLSSQAKNTAISADNKKQ